MSCKHDPFYTYTGWWCPLSPKKPCPSGYTHVAFESKKVRSDPDYCFGDAIKPVARTRRKCVRTSGWNPALKLACCLGTRTGGKYCAPEWCPNSEACDGVILDFCSDPANFDNPICGCALPASEYEKSKLFGPPECVDKRCATNPKAHRLSFQKNPTCNITNCVIGDIDVAAGNSNIDISAIKQYCGNRYKDMTGFSQEAPVTPGPIAEKIGSDTLVWAVGGVAVLSLFGMIATRPK